MPSGFSPTSAPVVESPDALRRSKRRKQAMVCYAIIAILLLLVAFSRPIYLLGVLAFGGYALYLYRGGTVILWSSLKPRKRSLAWIYYTIIAIAGIVVAFTYPPTLLVSLVAGAYAAYLYRGGRWVIWFW
jgi:4-hydroxybenzoate polyprenyltransferase